MSNSRRSLKVCLSLALMVGLFWRAPALAGDNAATEEMSVGDYLEAGAETATWAHGYISSNLEELARAIDSILGGERAFEETTGTYFRVRGAMAQVGDNEPKFNVDTKLQLVLPYTNDKLKIEFDSGRYLDKVVTADQTNDQLPVEKGNPATNRENLFAGLILSALRSDHWRVTMGGGIKVDWPPDPNARAQISWTTGPASNWRLNLGQGGFWYSSDGFSARTQAEVTGKITKDSLISLSGLALWTDGDNDWQLAQTLALLTAVDKDTGLSYRLGAIQETRPHISAENYFYDITCRRRLYSNWLFIDVRGSVTYPRSRDFNATPGVYIWLETLFKG